MTQEQIDKLKRIFNESTSHTARNMAEAKLKAEGIDLSAPASLPVAKKNKKPGPKKIEPTGSGQYKSMEIFKSRVTKALSKKWSKKQIDQAFAQTNIQDLLNTAFKKRWSAIYIAKFIIGLVDKKGDDESTPAILIAKAEERHRKMVEAKKKKDIPSQKSSPARMTKGGKVNGKKSSTMKSGTGNSGANGGGSNNEPAIIGGYKSSGGGAGDGWKHKKKMTSGC